MAIGGHAHFLDDGFLGVAVAARTYQIGHGPASMTNTRNVPAAQHDNHSH